MKRLITVAALFLGSAASLAGEVLPVIDVHMHALPYASQGPPPMAMCTPMTMPVWDQRTPYAETFFRGMKEPPCDDPIWSPTSDEENLERNLAVIEKHNVYGVLSGSRDMVDTWMAHAPGRFFPGLMFNVHPGAMSPDEIVALHEADKLDVLSEITTQYSGIEPVRRVSFTWAQRIIAGACTVH